jgi:hypothetical protein
MQALLILAQAKGGVAAKTNDVLLKISASERWCDGRVVLSAALENHGSGPLFVGVPSATRRAWPFPYEASIEQARSIDTKLPTLCGCSHGDCRLCVEPAVVVELAPGDSRSWQLEPTTQTLRAGRMKGRVVLNWFGSRTRGRARRDIMRASSTFVFTVHRLSRRCFEATPVE